ncbi:DUF4159 domain-containing protein [Brytella acorum]|uniref:DUF4159 domain-containing protein n=1 Tax=Brytella acorum TaxID=2959299 RepID=A0AA35VBV9_9PROT|nr:DUF4159 domain-containing protein [Brytella acorum]MDF3623446.1 DUF4159 domain-containing protein [Brytella acorum]CAI9120553.1 DUF4159 domain-containing protein [Brytella acorum]
MSFLAPYALIGLLALPVIWWLIKATPPPPTEQRFPSLMILNRLHPRRADTERAPLWLLLLRLVAAALVIVGLAQPVRVAHERSLAAGSGRLVIVLDDGWSAVPHWSERVRTARLLGDHALEQQNEVVLVRAARGPDGALPEPFATRDRARFDALMGRLRPESWGLDRHGLVPAIQALSDGGRARVMVLADGLATPDDAALKGALEALGDVTDIRWSACDIATLGATTASGLKARVSVLPCPARHFEIHARSEQGGTLAVFPLDIPAGLSQAQTDLDLPAILRNQTARLTLSTGAADGNGTALAEMNMGPAGIRLLDEGDRRRPVGLVATPNDDTPLVGSAFFLSRALGNIAELRHGSVDQLLGGKLSVLIAPDGTLSQEGLQHRVDAWVKDGGELIRFAGPAMAPGGDTPDARVDPLLPVALMGGVRQLGGPMSWGTPQKLAPFPEGSPFSGLNQPSDVTVTRQVLARPSSELTDHVWARLTDGTPLVTATRSGRGEIVLFHVTPSPDWSNLPISGLFPEMLQRLIQRSEGVRGATATATTLQPAETLDADGILGPPPPGARALPASAFGNTVPSAEHPPGLYGPHAQRRALNLGDAMAALTPEMRLGTPMTPRSARPEQPLGPLLLACGLLLLLLDLVLSLARRGLLRRASLALMLPVAGWQAAHAQALPTQPSAPSPAATTPATTPAGVTPAGPQASDAPPAALQTRLAYVVTGHDDIDQASREGLDGLSKYTADRSSAQLGPPDGVHPGTDDLAFYPLLYWPVTEDVQADPKRTAALNAFMAHGGIILIDTQGAGTELDPDGGGASRAALRRATDGLAVPPLMKLDDHHTIAHSFYLLHDFPGRVSGEPVWVARHGDEALDDVSPVIIGAADWAHAWAVGPDGSTPYAVIPGGEDQRTQAYRFGVNVVLYALTGNYKADQMKVPALLQRMGQ